MDEWLIVTTPLAGPRRQAWATGRIRRSLSDGDAAWMLGVEVEHEEGGWGWRVSREREGEEPGGGWGGGEVSGGSINASY